MSSNFSVLVDLNVYGSLGLWLNPSDSASVRSPESASSLHFVVVLAQVGKALFLWTTTNDSR